MDLFEKQWASYRAVVEHDLMEHRAVASATAQALEDWLARRPAGAPAPQLVDLGCGDLALLAPLLRRLPLGSYTGLDLTPAVLPLAEAMLGPVPYPTHWQEGDLLAWAMAAAPSAGDPSAAPVEILHSAFAVHHLSDGQKTEFLAGARRRIASDGLLIWADVFRELGESLSAYRQRYSTRIRRGWQPLNSEQQEQVIAHLSQWDIPAERGPIEAAAAAAGWTWQWVWQGQHRAEAVAVLTPA
ncbi:MAG: class I SAM-dependent methyltransferase [Synechococcus sp.]